MMLNRPVLGFVLIAGTVLCGCDKNPETPRSTSQGDNTPRSTPADNTARNRGDGSTDAKTPMDQSESSADIKVTAAIRRAVMADGELSTNAKNCKIITDKAGVVTLRGPVGSQVEKETVERLARAVAGVTRVDNMLEVTVK